MIMSKEMTKIKWEKQIEVTKGLIDLMEKIKPTLEKYDNKVVNVKLERELQEKFKGDNDYYISIRGNELRLSAYKRSFPVNNTSCEYVDYSVIEIALVLNEEIGKRPRLNYIETLEKINNRIEIEKKYIEDWTNTLQNIDTMFKESEELINLIVKWKEKYDSNIRSDIYDFRNLNRVY